MVLTKILNRFQVSEYEDWISLKFNMAVIDPLKEYVVFTTIYRYFLN